MQVPDLPARCVSIPEVGLGGIRPQYSSELADSITMPPTHHTSQGDNATLTHHIVPQAGKLSTVSSPARSDVVPQHETPNTSKLKSAHSEYYMLPLHFYASLLVDPHTRDVF